MNAIERLLSCKGNPVEFFELVEAARAEVDALRAKTANDAFVIHALRDVEGERDALKGVLAVYADHTQWERDDENYRGFENIWLGNTNGYDLARAALDTLTPTNQESEK